MWPKVRYLLVPFLQRNANDLRPIFSHKFISFTSIQACDGQCGCTAYTLGGASFCCSCGSLLPLCATECARAWCVLCEATHPTLCFTAQARLRHGDRQHGAVLLVWYAALENRIPTACCTMRYSERVCVAVCGPQSRWLPFAAEALVLLL